MGLCNGNMRAYRGGVGMYAYIGYDGIEGGHRGAYAISGYDGFEIRILSVGCSGLRLLGVEV